MTNRFLVFGLGLIIFTCFAIALPALSVNASAETTRFTDNGDNTVTDNKTGLMWLKTGRPTFGAMDFEKAYAFCETLQHAGHSDWHIPSKEEWQSIIDPSKENPALRQPNPFTDVVTYLDYWTRTEFKQGAGYSWTINLYRGRGSLQNKSKTAFAWPVRAAVAVAALEPGKQGVPAGRKASPLLKERIESRFTIIRYGSASDLAALDRKLVVSSSLSGVKYSGSNLFEGDTVSRVKQKMDIVYAKAQSILDMRKKMQKVIIEIYPDQDALLAAYGASLEEDQKPSAAFYVFNRNAIGLDVENVNVKIVAHQMALSIIDHFMPVRPPRKSAEIMAMFVDQQL